MGKVSVHHLDLEELFRRHAEEARPARPLFDAVKEDLANRLAGWLEYTPPAFKAGDVVRQREGYEVARFPTTDHPGIVIRRLNRGIDHPIAVSHGSADDSMTVLIGVVSEDGQWATYAIDPRRLELHPGWSDDERFNEAAE